MEFESRQGRSQAESFREGFDLCELDSGGQIPPKRVKHSLQILTHEVMPAFKSGAIAAVSKDRFARDAKERLVSDKKV